MRLRLLVARSLLALAVATLCPMTADAQTFGVRGFFDVGTTTFTASKSFDAVLGTPTGTVFGGGGEVVLPVGIFATVRASQFKKTGERAFVVESETFPLGIDTTIRIRPFEVSGGYRFRGLDKRLVPYAGAGIGWHRYEETSEFAEDDENVDETFRGYHLLGGAEFRLVRWFAVSGEFQWTTVPDALGQDPNGVSAAFEETDLGGTAFRVRFVIGR